MTEAMLKVVPKRAEKGPDTPFDLSNKPAPVRLSGNPPHWQRPAMEPYVRDIPDPRTIPHTDPKGDDFCSD